MKMCRVDGFAEKKFSVKPFFLQKKFKFLLRICKAESQFLNVKIIHINVKIIHSNTPLKIVNYSKKNGVFYKNFIYYIDQEAEGEEHEKTKEKILTDREKNSDTFSYIGDYLYTDRTIRICSKFRRAMGFGIVEGRCCD